MPSERFEVGDVVQLTSGGPHMTVMRVDEEDDYCYCQWFNDKHVLSDGSFPSKALLRPANPPDFIAVG
ncbi:MAG TPA: DUF2158 domain-containing protein [Pyrinomonadaceae bacterium]